MPRLISRTLTFVIILVVSWHASAVNFRETTKYNPYLFIGRVESASSIAVNVSGNPVDSMGTNNAEATFNLAEIRILKNLSPKDGLNKSFLNGRPDVIEDIRRFHP
jgi:hypothetical protein